MNPVSDIAIRVENLSKRYRIGARQNRPDTLWDAISDFGLDPSLPKFEIHRR